jgi:predicted DNA-binding transcriptional regulator AlpA
VNHRNLEVHPAVHEEQKKQTGRGVTANRPLGRTASDDEALLRGPKATSSRGSPASPAGIPVIDETPAVGERFLTVGEVLALTSWSRSTLYRSIRASGFPSPRVLSANRIGFLSSDVASWVSSRQPRWS